MSKKNSKIEKMLFDLYEVIDHYCPQDSDEFLVKVTLMAQAILLQETALRLEQLGIPPDEIAAIIESGKNHVVLREAEEDGLFALPHEEDV